VHLKGDSLPRVCGCLNGVSTAFGSFTTRRGHTSLILLPATFMASDVIRCNVGTRKYLDCRFQGDEGFPWYVHQLSLRTYQAELLTPTLCSLCSRRIVNVIAFYACTFTLG
jgi:hypothetical protein